MALFVDVTEAAGLGSEQRTAVSIFLPADLASGHPRIVAFGFPGGGYARGYWDIEWRGDRASYSQAGFHAGLGWIFVACDHLGVGDSTVPEAASATDLGLLARVNDATVRHIVEGLRRGSLVDGVGPVDVAAVVGLGQSMGGSLTIVAQSRFETFDAIAVLGYSAIHTVIPTPSGPRRIHTDAGTEAVAEELQDAFRWAFHWEDVPGDLVDADLAGGFPFRNPPVPGWASATVPSSAESLLAPGIVRDDAAGVTCPVFIGVGERDVCPDPHAEPGAYASSRDISLFVVPRMAHMHNFAGTREVLWRRLHAWGDSLVRSAPAG